MSQEWPPEDNDILEFIQKHFEFIPDATTAIYEIARGMKRHEGDWRGWLKGEWERNDSSPDISPSDF